MLQGSFEALVSQLLPGPVPSLDVVLQPLLLCCPCCSRFAAGPSFEPRVGRRLRVVVDPRGRTRQPWHGAGGCRGRRAVRARNLSRKYPRSGVGGKLSSSPFFVRVCERARATEHG